MISIRPLFNNSYEFPPYEEATEDGLLAYGGDLDTKRVMLGYKQGIFPWFDDRDPILWWSPDPRFILDINELKIPKSLKRVIKKNIFEIKYNTAFVQVLIECSNATRPEQEGTWIVPEMIECYSELHRQGFAHSFEAWLDGELVGGGYGVVVGDIFCGESMFTKVSDASKVAFVHVVQRLKQNGFRIIDSQVYTEHLERFGAKHISRQEYLKNLKQGLSNPKSF